MQLVSCRNVLIYFDRGLQERAVQLFRDALVPRGFLGLGSRESLHGFRAGGFVRGRLARSAPLPEAGVSGDVAAALRDRPPEVVVIGASAGAVDALMRLLPPLPAGLPVPLLVVVHVPADRRNALPALFAHNCGAGGARGRGQDETGATTVYFAPPDYHLLVEGDGSLALSVDEPVHYSRPAIDVLFESAAEAYGSRVLGILLSGASRRWCGGAREDSRGGRTHVGPDARDRTGVGDATCRPGSRATRDARPGQHGARAGRLGDLAWLTRQHCQA